MRNTRVQFKWIENDWPPNCGGGWERGGSLTPWRIGLTPEICQYHTPVELRLMSLPVLATTVGEDAFSFPSYGLHQKA